MAKSLGFSGGSRQGDLSDPAIRFQTVAGPRVLTKENRFPPSLLCVVGSAGPL